jgi:dTMP kinase
MDNGCFIVFEGIDGSGKTEQYRRLVKSLEKRRYDLVATKEPTVDSPIGKLIRSVLFKQERVVEEALALLFAADRVDHTERRIKPALERGAVVVSDRYVYSSLAYQSRGMGRELDLEWVRLINRYAIQPDVVIYLDVAPEVGQSRLSNGQVRVKDHTYFESLAQQERIRSVYHKVLGFENTDLHDYSGDPGTPEDGARVSRIGDAAVLRVDGALPMDEIEKIVLRNVMKALKAKGVKTLERKAAVAKSLEQFTVRKTPQ